MENADSVRNVMQQNIYHHLTYKKSNTGKTGWLQNETGTDVFVFRNIIPTSLEGALNSHEFLQHIANVAESAAEAKRDRAAKRKQAAKRKIDRDMIKAALIEHESKIANLHKHKNLDFFEIDDIDRKTAKLIYASPGFYGKAGSHYFIAVVNGYVSYVRESDHFGFFETKEIDLGGNDVWVGHNWTLNGKEPDQDGVRRLGCIYL